MKVIAIIVAGGSGTRFGSSIPKQYTNSILALTISKFIASKHIYAVQVIIRPEDQEFYNQVAENFNLLPVVFGGKTRSESVENALAALETYQPDLVLIHDANRPFVSTLLIEQIIEQLKLHPEHGVAPSLKITETVKRIIGENIEAVDRENLITIQTPQGFYFKQIHKIVQETKHQYTDETNLMEANAVPIIYLQGEKSNIKITFNEDIVMNYEIRTGMGFDAHKFSAEISSENHIILGGITIPFEKKLEAHSDGDVLIHSLVDAMLGAIGAGDIGMHFPPTDLKWKNANSQIFLMHANQLLKQKNGYINNIDITVICEKPRLGIYREQILNKLAEILQIDQERINIKATTTEKMGFTGRGEGIAVQAIATVSLPQITYSIKEQLK
ncbi:MAG: 2-C-methyl-D-erythritol 2,4-cyclodiphosphate synthase [Rickettsiales bacterium]